MITSSNSEADEMIALDFGADDYVAIKIMSASGILKAIRNKSNTKNEMGTITIAER